MACRARCETQDHRTYGECLRSSGIQVAKGESQQHWGNGYTTKSWDRELESYRAARREGIQPASTKQADIDAAVAMSRAANKPFDATTNTWGDGC